MAGHSQFKNIMHRKGRQDAQKSKLFSKLAREITVAAKTGLPDPNMNPRLRAAMVAARQENMPRDNIERAIKKAAGNDGENYDEIRYEGYGPGGVAVIVEALTDNRNRAASDIRSYFTKSGGNLGETGSVSFMFDHTGIIEYDAKVASDDAVLDAAIEAGADDVVSSQSGHEIYASQETFREVAKALEATSSAPASIAASSMASSEALLASYSMIPVRSNMKATEPVSPRLPPDLVKKERMSEAARLRLSVSASTMTATPPGP